MFPRRMRCMPQEYAEAKQKFFHLSGTVEAATLATTATQQPETVPTVATVATVATGGNPRDGPTAFVWRVRKPEGWLEVRFWPPANRRRAAMHYPELEAAPMSDPPP